MRNSLHAGVGYGAAMHDAMHDALTHAADPR